MSIVRFITFEPASFHTYLDNQALSGEGRYRVTQKSILVLNIRSNVTQVKGPKLVGCFNIDSTQILIKIKCDGIPKILQIRFGKSFWKGIKLNIFRFIG